MKFGMCIWNLIHILGVVILPFSPGVQGNLSYIVGGQPGLHEKIVQECESLTYKIGSIPLFNLSVFLHDSL